MLSFRTDVVFATVILLGAFSVCYAKDSDTSVLVGDWVYETTGGFAASLQIAKDGSVLWQVPDKPADPKWLFKLDDKTFLISDKKGVKGKTGWVVVHMTENPNSCVCDDWASGPSCAVMRKL